MNNNFHAPETKSQSASHFTLIACKLSQTWGDYLYYDDFPCRAGRDDFNLHFISSAGLTFEESEDLKRRELISYTHRILFDPRLKDRLFSTVKAILNGGLLEMMKAEDDKDNEAGSIVTCAERDAWLRSTASQGKEPDLLAELFEEDPRPPLNQPALGEGNTSPEANIDFLFEKDSQ